MGQKITNSVPGLYDKKKNQQLIVLFNSDVIKKVYLKGWLPPDLSPRFTCRVKLVKHKKSGLIFFYFGLPFRQRNASCKLAATEDYRVFIKLHFGTVQLSIVSPTEWLKRL